MAFPSSFLLITLLSLALSQASSQALYSNATLAGIVTCINASIAAVKTYPLVPDARVDVVCGVLFVEKVIKTAHTNLEGVYSFSFNVADTALLSVPQMCYLKVAMPDNSCVFDPSGGFVKLPIVVGLRSGLGMVTYFIPGAPSYSRP
ncbi:hypothetical protein SASPL_109999 [Salvia splendens]|uniref:Uncharacterized protein n=1 Tax=Salvia splendens TaxID=180675 RepID=A0A8X8Y958_SALSN|nr:uncharacterized protein LOC121799562 [Salvia splendens]KAG6425795.1 hypothetical protein SASPL_109999 [Salvia splendens]